MSGNVIMEAVTGSIAMPDPWEDLTCSLRKHSKATNSSNTTNNGQAHDCREMILQRLLHVIVENSPWL